MLYHRLIKYNQLIVNCFITRYPIRVACEAQDAFPVVASLRPFGGREATTGNASGASQATI